MKAENELPVKYTHGSTYGRRSKWYSRVLNGQQIWQHKPRRSSEKQDAWRKGEFPKRYGGRHDKPPPL